MSDGEIIEEAIANGREALPDCIEVFQESGRKVPRPGVEAAQWHQHQQLGDRDDCRGHRFTWEAGTIVGNPT
jgi:hypothetical protein